MFIKAKYEIESPFKDVAIGDTTYLNLNFSPEYLKNIPIIRDMYFKKIVVDGFFHETNFNLLLLNLRNVWRNKFNHGGGRFSVLNKLDGYQYPINNLLPEYGYSLEPKIIREISSVAVYGDKQIQRTIHDPERGLVFTKEYGELLRDIFSFNIKWNDHWEPTAVIVDGGLISIQNF